MSTKYRTALQIVLLSDTHELHREVDVPDGDVLVHSGDFTLFNRSLRAIQDFDAWLGELPHLHKVAIYGNHECPQTTNPSSKWPSLSNATVLYNKGLEICGLRFWGCAPNLSDEANRKRQYAQIPENTDILITHFAPYGILDSTPDSGFHSGCRDLFDRVIHVQPKLHVFGHVHGAHGIFQTDNTTFVNAALLGPNGDIDQSPIALRMRRK